MPPVPMPKPLPPTPAPKPVPKPLPPVPVPAKPPPKPLPPTGETEKNEPTTAEGKGYAGEEHPGFKALEEKIGKEPGIKNPGAVLAASTRNASPAAKKANPRLSKVPGA